MFKKPGSGWSNFVFAHRTKISYFSLTCWLEDEHIHLCSLNWAEWKHVLKTACLYWVRISGLDTIERKRKFHQITKNTGRMADGTPCYLFLAQHLISEPYISLYRCTRRRVFIWHQQSVLSGVVFFCKTKKLPSSLEYRTCLWCSCGRKGQSISDDFFY